MSNNRIFENNCDFCGAVTRSKLVKDQWQVFSWLEPIDGSGSDYLAIWCQDCGPRHRLTGPERVRLAIAQRLSKLEAWAELERKEDPEAYKLTRRTIESYYAILRDTENDPFKCPKCMDWKPFLAGSGDCQTCDQCCKCTSYGTYCTPY